MKKYLLCLLILSLMACRKNEMTVGVAGMQDKVQIVLKALDTNSLIYADSRQTNAIPDKYGENDWYLTYGDSLCARFRHFKFNANDTHSYHFGFFKKGEDIYCQVSIDGKDPVEHTIKLVQCREVPKP